MNDQKKYILVPISLEYNDEYYYPIIIVNDDLPKLINVFDSEQDAETARELLVHQTIKGYSIEEIFNEENGFDDVYEILVDKHKLDPEKSLDIDFGSEIWKEIYPLIVDTFSYMEVKLIEKDLYMEVYGEYDSYCSLKLKNGKFIFHNEKGEAILYEDYGEYILEGNYIGSTDEISEEEFLKIVKNYKLKKSLNKLLEI